MIHTQHGILQVLQSSVCGFESITGWIKNNHDNQNLNISDGTMIEY